MKTKIAQFLFLVLQPISENLQVLSVSNFIKEHDLYFRTVKLTVHLERSTSGLLLELHSARTKGVWPFT